MLLGTDLTIRSHIKIVEKRPSGSLTHGEIEKHQHASDTYANECFDWMATVHANILDCEASDQEHSEECKVLKHEVTVAPEQHGRIGFDA